MINVNAAGSLTVDWVNSPGHSEPQFYNVLDEPLTTNFYTDSSGNVRYRGYPKTGDVTLNLGLKSTGNNSLLNLESSYTYHFKQRIIVSADWGNLMNYLVDASDPQLLSFYRMGIVDEDNQLHEFEATGFSGSWGAAVDFDFKITGVSSIKSVIFYFNFRQELPSGKYILVWVYNTSVSVSSPNDDVIANDNKNHEEIKGFWNNLFSKLGDWFKGLLDGILNGLKSLFIPKDGFMEQFFSDIDDFLQQHLGALYYPFSVMIDILQKILAFQPPDNPSITLPKLSFPVDGTTYTLWEDTVYNFDILKDEPFKTIYSFYLMAVDCMFAFALVKLFKKKLDEVMTG